jgi:glycosyltransferase involved in cell wall biosynthesis
VACEERTVNIVHLVVPDGIDDPQRPSGGNVYDRRVGQGLTRMGWLVHERPVPGGWPQPDERAMGVLAQKLGSVPDGGTVLVDGIIASAAAVILLREAQRLRLCVLLHLPLGATTADEGAAANERSVLRAAAAVVTTSPWTRCWLLEHYSLCTERVHVAEPGVDHADLAPGTATGGRLLCVAALIPIKGHGVLLTALAQLDDLAWHCAWVGSARRDPAHVERLLRRISSKGLADRIELVGPRTGHRLEASYAGADLLVLPSRFESYGMVVTEALAHGLPVLATAVGGLPDTLGRLPDGRRPGLLVAPEEPGAMAASLRRWLEDAGLRETLRDAARIRRGMLTGWDVTAENVARCLVEVAA